MWLSCELLIYLVSFPNDCSKLVKILSVKKLTALYNCRSVNHLLLLNLYILGKSAVILEYLLEVRTNFSTIVVRHVNNKMVLNLLSKLNSYLCCKVSFVLDNTTSINQRGPLLNGQLLFNFVDQLTLVTLPNLEQSLMINKLNWFCTW